MSLILMTALCAANPFAVCAIGREISLPLDEPQRMRALPLLAIRIVGLHATRSAGCASYPPRAACKLYRAGPPTRRSDRTRNPPPKHSAGRRTGSSTRDCRSGNALRRRRARACFSSFISSSISLRESGPRSSRSPVCTRCVLPPDQLFSRSMTPADRSTLVNCPKSPCTSPTATTPLDILPGVLSQPREDKNKERAKQQPQSHFCMVLQWGRRSICVVCPLILVRSDDRRRRLPS